MKSGLTILLAVLLAVRCSAQSISINYDIDTTVFKVSEALNLWLDFLNTKDDSAGAKYWNTAEVEQYGADSYFLLEKELDFGLPNYLKLLSYGDLKVLSIHKIRGYYKITSLFEFPRKENKSNIQYIFHIYAARENGHLKLYNPLPINRELYLLSKTVGFIRYHYPLSHPFNLELAKKQSAFLLSLAMDFEVPVDTIDYYFAPTNEEINKIRGFDFLIGNSGEEIPSGKADPGNRIVYASGLAEYYPHEFIHILLNPEYPDCHWWINEGVATYFGMSRGKDLDWHLKRVRDHLDKNPGFRFDDLLKLRSLDQYTDYRYVIGGLIVKKAYEKGGVELVKALMQAGKSDDDFYQALEKFLGIRKEEIDGFIRESLEIQSR